VRNPLAALAGKKATKLYRNPDGSTVLHVDDEHDEILVTVEPDGSMFEERWSGLAGVREALEAASPHFNAMQVPNDAERKVWTHLEPEPEPVVEPEPEPAHGPPPGRRVDPQYEAPKEERDTPFTRSLSWGPDNI
jgi:hypothetical protein